MDWSDQQHHAARFCDMVEEPGQMMLPIQGYEKMPLVILEKAVEPLVSIVPEVKRMVWIVKQNCKNPPDNLSSDESASIMLYSMGWQPIENSFYNILNRTLCIQDRSVLKPWFLYLKLVFTALSKIPSEKHYVYRGVKKDLSNYYPQGKIFVWWGFSSCTKSIHILENELFLGKTGTRTLFTIDCHSGKDIYRHSMYKKENEVLLPPARQFRVVSCMNAGNGLNFIQIEEIGPPHPLLEPLSMSNAQIPLIKINGPYRNPSLEQTIRKCSSRKINLNRQQLNDEDMKIVTKEAIIDKQCMKLDLMYNEITQRGVSILADALCNNKYLEEFNISHNNISDSGVRDLASAINSSALKYVDLAQNDISDEGAKYLAEMLTTNTNMLELSLSQNRIGNYGVKLLADALIHSNTCLELLNLSANTDIDDESIDSVVNMMEHNRSLKKLDLRHNNISKDGERRLQGVAKSRKGFELWGSHFI
jgi:hypothetical protein